MVKRSEEFPGAKRLKELRAGSVTAHIWQTGLGEEPTFRVVFSRQLRRTRGLAAANEGSYAFAPDELSLLSELAAASEAWIKSYAASLPKSRAPRHSV